MQRWARWMRWIIFRIRLLLRDTQNGERTPPSPGWCRFSPSLQSTLAISLPGTCTNRGRAIKTWSWLSSFEDEPSALENWFDCFAFWFGLLWSFVASSVPRSAELSEVRVMVMVVDLLSNDVDGELVYSVPSCHLALGSIEYRQSGSRSDLLYCFSLVHLCVNGFVFFLARKWGENSPLIRGVAYIVYTSFTL